MKKTNQMHIDGPTPEEEAGFWMQHNYIRTKDAEHILGRPLSQKDAVHIRMKQIGAAGRSRRASMRLWNRADAIAYAEKVKSLRRTAAPIIPENANGTPMIAQPQNNFGKLVSRVAELESRMNFIEQIVDSYTNPNK